MPISEIQVGLRLEANLVADNWTQTLNNYRYRVSRDAEFVLDCVDWALGSGVNQQELTELSAALTNGGSAWEPSIHAEGWLLTRRAAGPVPAAIDQTQPLSERAHAHLTQAWIALMGRHPNPGEAYRESVKAVEVAAKPIVTPNDSMATLGKIIRALLDAPQNWSVALERGSTEDVARMAQMLWTSQLDRHGTDDQSAPLSVGREEADPAFYLALALVRFFLSGAIRRA